MLTQKENYLMTLDGKIPEWIPSYNIDYMGGTPDTLVFLPKIVGAYRDNKGGRNVWGVNYITSEESAGGVISEPGVFLMDDVDDMEHWGDFIKAPDLTGIDWEKMVNDHLNSVPLDRNQTAVCVCATVGIFQDLVAFMGFENALVALYEYPDEVQELFDYTTSFYEKVLEKTIDLYKPDIFDIWDDTASWQSQFMSDDMYRELILPYEDRLARFGRERGLHINMHNCGKCGTLVEDWLSIGVDCWNPAQTCNDLVGIKAKYGDRLTIAGGWDARDHLLAPDVTEEEIYESVKQTMDTLAPGGHFIWCGGFLCTPDDKVTMQKNMTLFKAVHDIGHDFYK